MIATSKHGRAYILATVAVVATIYAVPAFAQSPPPTYDGRDKNFEIMAGSTLRSGDRLLDRVEYTLWHRQNIKGAGTCSAESCPVAFNGQTLYARRSRLIAAGIVPGSPDYGNGATRPPGTTGSDYRVYPSGYTRRLERGDRGEDVRRIQEALNRVGNRVTADGNFGRGTRQAVIDFQRRNGLPTDGVVGAATMRALGG